MAVEGSNLVTGRSFREWVYNVIRNLYYSAPDVTGKERTKGHFFKSVDAVSDIIGHVGSLGGHVAHASQTPFCQRQVRVPPHQLNRRYNALQLPCLCHLRRGYDCKRGTVSSAVREALANARCTSCITSIHVYARRACRGQTARCAGWLTRRRCRGRRQGSAELEERAAILLADAGRSRGTEHGRPRSQCVNDVRTALGS